MAHIEDKYSAVKQLIELGKEKGYLLYDEIYEMLPDEVVSLPEELDEIYIRFGELGIDVIDRPERYLNREDLEPTPSRVRQEGRGGPRVHRSRRAREDQRPGAHVPARDGHGAAARPRGRGGDRPAHRARRVAGLRGAVREPGGPARAAAPERDGGRRQEGAARADVHRSGRAARSQGRGPHQVEPQDLRADRQARPRDPEAAQEAGEVQGGRRASGRSSSARSTAWSARSPRRSAPIDFSRADPQSPGRFPEGPRPPVLGLRTGHQARPDGAEKRARTRSCRRSTAGASRSTAARSARSRSATARRTPRSRRRSRRSARARASASGRRRS